MQPEDARWMDLALRDAAKGLGRVAPNPAVGCVIVKDGRLLARARTADGGRPHAETVALAQASTAARGATAYVTLEPCAHHGKTDPCCDALVASGIARVVCAMPDPDSRVAGQGIARMRAGGVQVDVGLMVDQARQLNAGYLKVREQGLPFLTLKLATSLDGRIATASGESRWITGPAARQYLHLMRAQHDAVMVGAGTVRADDPMLDVRLPGHWKQPLRVVASRDMNLPQGRLFQSAATHPLLMLHGPNVPEGRDVLWKMQGADLASCKISAGHLDPEDMLKSLADLGVTRILCEGGGQLAASLLNAGLVDELAIFTAGLALGGDGIPAIGPLGLGALAEHARLRLSSIQAIGQDTLTLWRA